jgi:hypothetical protein
VAFTGGRKRGRHLTISPNTPRCSRCSTALGQIDAYDVPIIIRGDSALVVNHMWGAWRIKRGVYVPLALEAAVRIKRFKSMRGEWIPREQNELADSLSKLAVEVAMNEPATDWPGRAMLWVEHGELDMGRPRISYLANKTGRG